MVLVNSTHIGLLLPNPIVISIRIRCLLNILIVIPIEPLLLSILLIEVYTGLLKPMVGGTMPSYCRNRRKSITSVLIGQFAPALNQ